MFRLSLQWIAGRNALAITPTFIREADSVAPDDFAVRFHCSAWRVLYSDQRADLLEKELCAKGECACGCWGSPCQVSHYEDEIKSAIWRRRRNDRHLGRRRESGWNSSDGVLLTNGCIRTGPVFCK